MEYFIYTYHWTDSFHTTTKNCSKKHTCSMPEPQEPTGCHASRPRRSWIWKYFVKLNSSTFKCDTCGGILSLKFPYYTNNMIRHFRFKHPSTYKAERKKSQKLLKSLEENDGSKMTIEAGASSDVMKQDLSNIKEMESGLFPEENPVGVSNTESPDRENCADVQYEVKTETTTSIDRNDKISNVEAQDLSSTEEARHMENEFQEFHDKSEAKSSESKKKRCRSWIWSHFEKVNNQQYKCNVCKAVLTIRSRRNNTNMNRHYRKKHPLIYASIVKQTIENNEHDEEVMKDFDDVEASTISDQLSDDSWVLILYDCSDDDIYTCKLCDFKSNKILDARDNIANLHEHLSVEHGLSSSDQVTIQDEDDDN